MDVFVVKLGPIYRDIKSLTKTMMQNAHSQHVYKKIKALEMNMYSSQTTF